MPVAALLTIKEALLRSAQWLGEKGIESPRLDAEVLLARLLNMRRLDLYLAWDRPLDEEEKQSYRALLKRRAEREPVAYITGNREFHSLDFRVTPAVLIPRPETELLVERAIELVRGAGDAQPLLSGESSGETSGETSGEHLRIADVGTGSGAVAVVLAREFPGARITATDVSAAALEIARENAAKHGVSESIAFRRTQLLEGTEEPFDLIVSNPPYVAERDRATLPPDVALHEPPEALFAGEDGLDVIRALIPCAAERLVLAGWLVFEIGAGQAESVEGLIAKDGRFGPAEIRKDYRGIARVVSAKRLEN